MTTHMHAGDLLREWRQRRRLSQLDLAIQANVSSRHLSFVETGRARPSSEMILHLAEHLDMPLRDRNALLLAGGYAPAYPERTLEAPELHAVQHAELAASPGGPGEGSGSAKAAEVVVPLRYRTARAELSFLSLTAVIGTPMDVTVAELAIESFFPADEATAAAL